MPWWLGPTYHVEKNPKNTKVQQSALRQEQGLLIFVRETLTFT